MGYNWSKCKQTKAQIRSKQSFTTKLRIRTSLLTMRLLQIILASVTNIENVGDSQSFNTMSILCMVPIAQVQPTREDFIRITICNFTACKLTVWDQINYCWKRILTVFEPLFRVFHQVRSACSTSRTYRTHQYKDPFHAFSPSWEPWKGEAHSLLKVDHFFVLLFPPAHTDQKGLVCFRN